MIDVHTHIWLGRVEDNRKGILYAAERYGCTRMGVSTLGGGHIPNEQNIEDCNKATADFIRDYPGLIRGWCYVNPRHENALDVAKRGMNDQAMFGIKLWVATKCDDPLVFPIAEYCCENDIPVLIHALDKSTGNLEFESRGINVRNLAKRYPELRIVMAHVGGNEYTGIRPIIDCPNVSVDICGMIHRADTIEYAIERIGVKRIMYGTDLSAVAQYDSFVGRVTALDISDEDKERIFTTNALDLGM